MILFGCEGMSEVFTFARWMNSGDTSFFTKVDV